MSRTERLNVVRGDRLACHHTLVDLILSILAVYGESLQFFHGDHCGRRNHRIHTLHGTISLCIAQAKYLSTTNYCSQLLWRKCQLEDYDIFESKIPLLCDNNATINLSKNPIFHSY
ncbi:hypothetical protein CR513_44365, partial [Mucuna pruriens]